jgi:hypothetical protein
MGDRSNINAVITFSNDERMDVQSTVQQIEDAIGGITVPNIIPVIKVVDVSGRVVRINVNHIREIREYDPAEG